LPSATPETRFFYSGSFPAVFRIKVESVATSGRKVRLQKKRGGHMKELLIGKLLTATPEQLKKIAAVFNGEPTEQAEVADRKLLSIQQAAATLGVSRTTVWRLLKAGRLPVVELRQGSRRIPSAAITAFVQKGRCA